MDFKVLLEVCVLLTCLAYYGNAIRWLSLQKSTIKWNASISNEIGGRGVRSGIRSPCSLARRIYGLVKLQTKICRSSMETMPFVESAATLAGEACKAVFQQRRWNCSSIDNAPYLTPDLIRGTREQAFVYAISSASLTYTVARACANGGLHHCTCANKPQEPPDGNFKWGGCGDNIRWGVQFTKRFVDAVEKFNTKSQIAEKTEERKFARIYDKKFLKLKGHLAAVNLHNNRVGRRIMIENIIVQCKCHGVSGSCSIRTCWRSMPTMTKIGEKLILRFTNAREMVVHYFGMEQRRALNVGSRKAPSVDELVYLTKSPDYCTRDEKLGSVGTMGRKCNVSSNGTDSCRQLCCGRGYRTMVEEKIERCQCKYYYCCYVKCKTCKTYTQIHECS